LRKRQKGGNYRRPTKERGGRYRRKAEKVNPSVDLRREETSGGWGGGKDSASWGLPNKRDIKTEKCLKEKSKVQNAEEALVWGGKKGGGCQDIEKLRTHDWGDPGKKK